MAAWFSSSSKTESDVEAPLLPSTPSPPSSPLAGWLPFELSGHGGSSTPKHHGKHHAFIGASKVHIESLDYEVIDSDVFQGDRQHRFTEDDGVDWEDWEYHAVKWTFAFLIGVGTAAAAFGINMAVENVAGLKFLVTDYFMQRGHFFLAFVLYASINVLLVTAAATLCVYVAPAAAGSGIPEVKAYLNGVDTPGILAPKTLLVKILGSVGSVAGGLAVGKEGPLVHTGACIASFLGQGGSKKWGLDFRFLRWFKNDRDRRDLVTCGASAGVGAAFRAPVGGVLFALEEATSWWRSKLLWKAFFTTAVVAIAIKTAMSYCANGACGLFGDAGFIIFDQSSMKSKFALLELVPVCIIGVTGGILGGLFNRINVWICEYRREALSKPGEEQLKMRAKIFEAGLIALITSVCSYGIPWLTHCSPCPDVALHPGIVCPNNGRVGNFKGFHCPPGHYSDLAGLLFSTNDDATRNLFSARTPHEFRYSSLFVFLGTMFTLAVTTYGIAVPSGLFVPAILTGSAYGRLIGMYMVTHFGGDRIDEGTYALLGAASFLGGSMRMTVSICVILIELTSNLEMLPLLMITLLISKTIGDMFNKAIYDLHIELKGIPLLEQDPGRWVRRYKAKEAIDGPENLVTLRTVEKVENLLRTLKKSQHNAFPVVEHRSAKKPDGDVFYGLILRHHLIYLLREKKAFQPDISVEDDYKSVHSSIEFGKPSSGKTYTDNDITIKDTEMGMYLDLRPYTNQCPYTVSEDMSLFKVYQIFRSIGLRHIAVVPKATRVLGLITRKDLMEESYIEEDEEEAPAEPDYSSTTLPPVVPPSSSATPPPAVPSTTTPPVPSPVPSGPAVPSSAVPSVAPSAVPSAVPPTTPAQSK